MIKKYATKLTINGNAFQCVVDTDAKTFEKGYFLFIGKGDATKTKKEIVLMCDNLSKIGFSAK